jgi:phosphatidylglycerophosphate synthase
VTSAPQRWDEYAAQWAGLHGGVDPRRTGGAIYGWLRLSYAIGRGLVGLRIGAAVVTAGGLVLSLLVPPFVNQRGWWVLVAALLVLLSALADSVDGAVALIGRRATRLGFVYDSLCDRICEVAWLAGLKLLGVPGWLIVTCLAIAWIHEYLRARAVAAGMVDIGVVTAAERPTRVTFATLGLALGGISGFVNPELAAGTTTAVVAIWTVFGLIGLAQLLTTVHVRLRHRPAPNIRVVEEDPHKLSAEGRGAGGVMSVAPNASASASGYPRAEASESVDSYWAQGGAGDA